MSQTYLTDRKESYDKDGDSPVHNEYAVPTISKIDNDSDVVKVIDVRSAALEAAKAKGTTNPWSKDSCILYLCCFVGFLCSCANGYDGSLMTTINIMPYYQAKFNSGEVGSTTGIIFSIYTIGGMVGPWVAGPIADRWGRRAGMFAGAWIICIGSAVISSSNVRGQFIAGRFILGFGVSVITCAAPSYVVEISPPQWRGRMTALYNCGWFGGSIPAAGITLATQSIQSDLSWRIPLICQCFPAFIVICTVWFLPESPRWLLANSKDGRALAFLTRFHGNNDPHHPLVTLEWQEFKEKIAIDGSDKRWWDYTELFKTANARWRSLMVVLMGVCGQFSGNGLGYFNTQIYAAVGYDNHQQFVLNLVGSVVTCIGSLAGVALSDRMPRRKVLVSGTFACAVFLAINGGLSAVWAKYTPGEQNLSVGQGAVAAFFFFNLAYGFTYLPLAALYPVECLQTTARAKGMAMSGVVVNLMLFINQFCGPIALQNIQYNYVFIFVGWDVIETIIWYFLAVETVGRSLEELEEIFSARNPVKASKLKRSIVIKKGGEVALVEDA